MVTHGHGQSELTNTHPQATQTIRTIKNDQIVQNIQQLLKATKTIKNSQNIKNI